MPLPHEPVSYRWAQLSGIPLTPGCEWRMEDGYCANSAIRTAMTTDILKIRLANSQLITIRRKERSQ